MANTCKIKNKMTRKEIKKFVTEELAKINLKCSFEGDKETPEYIGFVVNGINFPMYLEKDKKIEMYDCASSAWDRGNYGSEYTQVAHNNSFWYYGLTCAYAYIYEYVKHSLAHKNRVKINSDGAGPYKPFYQGKEVFASFDNWLNHYTRKGKIEFSKLFKPSIAKIKRTEKKFFPELFD